jgi:2-polyprenyl-3-methyl-5-hydroxy-6-metoxy-1,4-benzoquinol methylase
MTIETEIIKFLDDITNACQNLKKAIVHTPQVEAQSLPTPQLSQEQEFEELKKLLEDERWPDAVNPALIVDPKSIDDKTERARGIIELIIDDELKGLKFLDFGCGEGFCAHLGAEYGTNLSAGYDLVKHPQWRKFEQKDNVVITNDFGLITKNGPYDVILLFDILDHVKNETPTDILTKAKDLLAPSGKIYVRFHPSTSRHATHHYHDVNKAYLNLVFTEEELRKIIPQSTYSEKNIGSYFPISSYDKIVKDSGLVTVHKREIKENPEEFFKMPLITNRIIRNTGHKQYPEFQMSLSFVDMVLQKS